MNELQKQAFLNLPLEDQLLAIIDGQTFIREKILQLEERQKNFEIDTRSYRILREKNEVVLDDLVDRIIEALRNNADR